MIFGKLFSFVGGALMGTLFGGIVGFMLGKGVNPLGWAVEKFKPPKSE